MSIQLAPSIEAQINQRVERGTYADADAVIEEALPLLDARDRKASLMALLQEGMDDIERGDVVEMTDDFWATLIREADEEDRLGVPIAEHVQPQSGALWPPMLIGEPPLRGDTVSITIAEPAVEERIRRHVDSGRFADAGSVVAHALDEMELVERKRAERADKLDKLRALIAEGDADFERGDFVEWTPTLLSEILADARAASQRGDPIPDHVKP